MECPVRTTTRTHTPAFSRARVGYRFYEPNLQRWLNRDPLGEAAFRTTMLHQTAAARQRSTVDLYTFVRNAPTSRTDPVGLLDLLPEDSAENCFQNCLIKKRAAPGLAKAIRRYGKGHVAGVLGTGVCGTLAVLEGGLNPIADAGLLVFGGFEAYEIYATVDHLGDLRWEARVEFATLSSHRVDELGKRSWLADV